MWPIMSSHLFGPLQGGWNPATRSGEGRGIRSFLPLDDLVDFYLFQAPPAFGDVNRILAFAGATGLGDRCAVEIRNPGVPR